MNFIGNITEFDHKIHQWDIYNSRLSQFIKLNAIKDENRSAVLLTHLSEESYRLARNLVHPKKLEEIKYDELVKVLSDHFTPKRSTFADRAKFYEATKSEGESSEEWAARLRGLAVYCEFGTELDTLLRDRFVLGFKTGRERDKLFECDSKTLTFAQALEVAQKAACARQAREEVVVKEEPVYRVHEAGRRSTRGGGASNSGAGAGHGASRRFSDDDQPRCSVCGLKNHNTAKCRFKSYKCDKCGQKGHLKKVCDNKKAHINNIDTDEINSLQESDCKECELYNMRYVHYSPIKITVNVNNISLCMELDTGSGVTVIPKDLYLLHFSTLQLCKSNITMCLYNGHRITPCGYFVAKISYSNMCNEIKIYVMKNGGPSLLGRDFMVKFKMYFVLANNINYCNSVDDGKEVQHLLDLYPDVWKNEVGCFNKFEVELQLKENTTPKFFKPRTVPFALRDRVSKEIDRLVNLGILIPVSYSEYATPIVPVLKENGKLKIAGDFSCTLNKDLKVDKYPLPRIEEVFSKIGGGESYSKIDLSNAYNQFKLSKSSQKLTTINTHKGLFAYTRLVYGLANAPAIFQKAMETLLSGLEGVSVWLDDICITGPTKQIHLSRLQEVLRRLQDAGLCLQKDKCAFFKESVTYLGYVIDRNGLRTCPTKVEAIIKAPAPASVLDVKRFLGVVNYYRNFIPNASSLLSPLHELLCAGTEWQWRKEQQAAFECVKRELASPRVLAHFNPQAPLVLTVDAGPRGLGAVLAHRDTESRERPIAFASRSLSASEKNYSQIQKEATAIIFGVKHFHQYLYGREVPFILKTDHRPLLSIFGKGNGVAVTAALRLQRYALILSAYNYTVQYIDGKNNQIADYFSRSPLSSSVSDTEEDSSSNYLLFLESAVKPVLFSDIKRAIAADKVLQTVMKYVNNGWPRKIKCKLVLPYFNCKTDLEIIDGCLFRGHRIVIPSVYRGDMLKELHSAHFGVVKTKSAARSRMWWPGIDADIEQWVGACAACAALRPAPARAPPAPWPRPPGPWHRLHIDYMTVGHSVYLIVIDAFSKWLECVYIDRGTSTNALILKLKEMFCRFGVPNVIVSDNDVKISSNEFHTFCKVNGIEYLNSPIYHPASNGQAENSVKTCKKMIKCILANTTCKKGILEKLQDFLFSYRNTVHCATGVTPAMLMLGRNLRCKLDLILPNNGNHNKHTEQVPLKRSRCFDLGETVWAKWFIARKGSWSIGIVTKIIGSRMYEIYFKEYGTKGIRHVNQIRKFINDKITSLPEQPDIGGSLVGPQAVSKSVSPEAQAAPSFPSTTTSSGDQVVLSSPTPTMSSPPTTILTDSQDTVVTEANSEVVASDVVRERGVEDNSDVPVCQQVQGEKGGVIDGYSDANKEVLLDNNVTPVGRSKRPRKDVNYKQYFK